MIIPTQPTWNKKISLLDSLDICDEISKWERIDITYIVVENTDQQQQVNVWADDNAKKYFHSEVTRTEGGTPIVRNGEKVNMRFWFQDEDDAAYFKMVWG